MENDETMNNDYGLMAGGGGGRIGTRKEAHRIRLYVVGTERNEFDNIFNAPYRSTEI